MLAFVTTRGHRVALVVLVVYGLSWGCRPRGDLSREASGLTLKEVADDLPTQPQFERITVDAVPGERSGFDFQGATACLSLPEGRVCHEGIGRTAALLQHCAAVGGVPVVCEDCSVLCSVDVAGLLN